VRLTGELVKELIDAGIHFGHRVSRWNPKMKPYIFGRRNLIHIINVKETLRGILAGKKFLARAAAGGKDVLFVGTKRQARKAVEAAANRAKMHWVNDRWLGGTLTNFREIRKRIGRLEQLEQSEAEGLLDQYSKKQGASFRREMRKMRRNLGGIRRMDHLPGALVVIDQRRELIAVREARKLGIPVICLLDTDSDPDLVDIPIPGNDDAMRAIELVVDELCEGVMEGLGARQEVSAVPEQPAARRRTRRPVLGRAKEVSAAPPEPAPAEAKPEAPEQAAPPVAEDAAAPQGDQGGEPSVPAAPAEPTVQDEQV
jgi:small subunit ribosomal protein S2